MAFDYLYGIRLDSEGSGTAFGTDAQNVRILPEQHPALRGRPSVIANRHGSVSVARDFFGSYDFVLEVLVSYGTPETAANFYDRRSGVLERIMHHLETVWLQRTAPDQGTVEIPIKVLRSPRGGNPRHRLMIPCRTLDPFWRDQAVTHSAVNPASGVTVNGDAPIGDSVLVVSGGTGVQRLTHDDSGDYIELNFTTTPAVTIDLGAGTVKQSGAHIDNAVTDQKEPWGIELQPGTNPHTVTGTGAWTLTARDKWL